MKIEKRTMSTNRLFGTRTTWELFDSGIVVMWMCCMWKVVHPKNVCSDMNDDWWPDNIRVNKFVVFVESSYMPYWLSIRTTSDQTNRWPRQGREIEYRSPEYCWSGIYECLSIVLMMLQFYMHCTAAYPISINHMFARDLYKVEESRNCVKFNETSH